MLKGYTKIELTDVNTGEKEVVEKHNLITNNLTELIKHLELNMGIYAIRYSLCPLYEKALGGIVLLSDTIDEDANAYHVAYTSKDMLTGCAGNEVNSGTDVKVGSKNLTESKAIENGYQLVWDFGTAQANGTIAAVGLTFGSVALRSNYMFAYPTYSVDAFFGSPITDLHKYLVDYDFEQNIATLIRTVDASTVNVMKYKFDLTTIHLNDKGYSSYISFSTQKILDKNISSSLELDAKGFWLDGFDGYYYYVNLRSLTQQYIARMKKDTLQIDTSYGLTKINLDMHDSTALNDPYVNKCCAIANGYLYAPRSRDCSYNKVDLSDLSKIEKVKNNDGVYIDYKSVASDGKLIYTIGRVILSDDSNIQYNKVRDGEYGGFNIGTDISYEKIIVSNKGMAINADYSHANYVTMSYFANNLNTINNLETPVTKTSDKTMKITYTLTEE